ncbi:hypothetical protein NL108_012494, partial [Boleophthalmus pectinirostris]
SYLDYDSTLTDKETVALVEEVVLLIAFAVTEIKRLLFIENIVDSIKFAVLLYLLTYVGVMTTGLTLVITAVIAMFSFPILYKKQQVSSLLTMTYNIASLVISYETALIANLYESVRPSEPSEPASKPAITAVAAATKQKAKSK